MAPRPPSLLRLLSSLLLLSTFARGQLFYTIDDVGLRVLPSETVQSGTAVSLRCEVRVSHGNIPNLTHTFQLMRGSSTIYTNTSAEDSVAWVLDPARAGDSGDYTCQVTVKDRKRTSASHKLTVTGLQTPILWLNTTKPFNSKEFTATCSAPQEKGFMFKFSFYQRLPNGDPQSIKELETPLNSLETELVLKQVGSSFLFCKYDINLFSAGIRSSNHSKEIRVDVQALFIKPFINVLPSSDVFEGDFLEVVCKVVNAPPGLKVYLIKDRIILTSANNTIVERFPALSGNAGEYVCKSEWGSVQKESYQSIRVRELFSQPQLNVDPQELFEGKPFTLSCFVTNIHESVDKEKLRFFISRGNVILSSSETYAAVGRPSNNGNYSCRVWYENLSNKDVVKQSTNVLVVAKVPVSKPRLSVVGGVLVLGKPFQLQCHSDNGTLPIVYSLYGPGVERGDRTVTKPGQRAVFNSTGLSKVLELDNFLCHAKNGQKQAPMQETGRHLQQTTNIIEPVSKPMVRPNAWSISEGNTLTLTCSVQRGTPPITFTWYHDQKVAPLKSRTSLKREESHSISGVKREDEGRYYCVFSNSANETRTSEGVRVAVTLATWKKGLIAAFCILLLLALILGCVFKKCLHQFKGERMGKRMGKLSVKSAGTKVERLSLTQAEFDQAANVTPGMISKTIWSEAASGSESDDQNSLAAAEPQYTEVQIRPADPSRDSVHGDVRNSKQGVPEPADAQGSVEYAELNHDTDHCGDGGNHGNPSVQEDHAVEVDTGADTSAAACEN